MSPTHHPAVDRLLEHAAGQLPPGQDLVIAAHVAVCGACRAEVRRNETLGGALVEAAEPAAMAPDALQHALARIERPAAAKSALAEPVLAMPVDWIDFSSPAVEAAWRKRRWAAPGVWVGSIFKGPGKSSTYLLGVAAGMSVPFHRHSGDEFTTVLKGAFDDRGQCFRPGDFAEADDQVRHKPAVTAEGDCICLISTEAPLVPLDWVGKLFQPFVRI
jgi:putative transcriptional regulator